MARHAQARAVAELKGTTKTHPDRYRGEVADSGEPIGQPFDMMSDEAKSLWHEILRGAPDGIFTSSDRHMFKVLCNLMSEYDESPKEFPVGKYTHLIGLSARFGMTTADRQKFITEKPKKANPFAELEH